MAYTIKNLVSTSVTVNSNTTVTLYTTPGATRALLKSGYIFVSAKTGNPTWYLSFAGQQATGSPTMSTNLHYDLKAFNTSAGTLNIDNYVLEATDAITITTTGSGGNTCTLKIRIDGVEIT